MHSFELASSSLTCQKLSRMSIIVKMRLPCKSVTMSSNVGIWKCSRLIALLSGRGSRQTRSWPFGFSTVSSALTQSVDSLRLQMICSCSIRSSSARSFAFRCSDIFRVGWITGRTDASTAIEDSPGIAPTTINTSAHSSISGNVVVDSTASAM